MPEGIAHRLSLRRVPRVLHASSASLPAAVVVLFGLAIALRLCFVFFLPFGVRVEYRLQGLNDEPSHYNYVKYLAQYRSFPVQKGSIKDGEPFQRNDFEYYQPPLYYLVGAALDAVFGGRWALPLCRMISFVCGILTIVMVGKLLEAAGVERQVRQAAMLFIALLPTHAYFCSVASNDAMSWLIAVLITRELFRIGGPARQPFTPKRAALLALYLSLGMLTKSSLAVFYPLSLGVIVYGCYKRKKCGILIGGALAVALSLAAVGPWYMRNLHLYGSLLALSTGFGKPAENLRTLLSIAGFVRMTVHYFWFPMLHAPGGTAALRCLNYLGTLIIGAHGIAAAWFITRRENRTFLAVLLLCLLALAAAAYVRLNLDFSNPEGRYLFPALAAIAFFFTAPARAFFGKMGWGKLVIGEICAVALYPYLFLLFVKI